MMWEGTMRLGLGAMLSAAAWLLAPGGAAAQICDREGYTRERDCPSEARDATACCPPARPRPPPRPAPCEQEGKTRAAAHHGCCWPGQRWREGECRGVARRCPLGWGVSGDECQPMHASVRGWDYPEVLGPSRGVARTRLERAFVELGEARRALDANEHAQAAAHYESAASELERARHPRGSVFRYRAAWAWERAGERERAEAQLSAYLAAGGEDPPAFAGERVGFEVQRAAWRSQPSWSQSEALWSEIQGRGSSVATPEVFVALATAGRASAAGRHAEAAGHYDALQGALWRAGAAHPSLRLHAASAWSQARNQAAAIESYAVYLALGGEDPPPEGAPRIDRRVPEAARALRTQWEAHYTAGQEAAAAGRHAEAREAFVASFTEVEGHPRQADALLGLARAPEAEGIPMARMTGGRALQRAWPGTRTRAEAERLSAFTRTVAFGLDEFCALVNGGEALCGRRFVWPARASRVSVEGQPLRATRLTGSDRHACALEPQGTVRCWGLNDRGQLGDGSRAERSTPVSVHGLSGAVDVAAGAYHTCALRDEGSVQCWGSNSTGQLGDGRSMDRSRPSAPVAGLTDAVQIDAGFGHSCALRAGGEVVCWGHRHAGSGADRFSTVPVEVVGLRNVIALSAGTYHTCALRREGSVHCWGSNDARQLGTGNRLERTAPIEVAGVSDAIEIAAGGYHTCARLHSGAIRCWGSVVNLHTVWEEPRDISGLHGVVELIAGSWMNCTRHEDGEVRCWRVSGDARAIIQ